jgi:hypothetical protein
MNDFQKQAVIVAVKKMFTDQYFSICTLDSCIKVCGVTPNKQDYETLKTLHCVDWADMPTSLREVAQIKILQMLGANNTFDAKPLIDKMFANEIKHIN